MGTLVTIAPVVIGAGAPLTLAYSASVVFAGIPCMIAVLLVAHKRIRDRPVVRNREHIPAWQYPVLFFPLLALAFGLLVATAPLNQWPSSNVFHWLPDYLRPDWEPVAPPGHQLILLGLLLQFLTNGVLAPVIEEVYFRGYLLPRMGRLNGWAPAATALLFSVQHLWQPIYWVLLFILNIPLTYVVWWKRNFYISILLHVTGNCVGAALALHRFLVTS